MTQSKGAPREFIISEKDESYSDDNDTIWAKDLTSRKDWNLVLKESEVEKYLHVIEISAVKDLEEKLRMATEALWSIPADAKLPSKTWEKIVLARTQKAREYFATIGAKDE